MKGFSKIKDFVFANKLKAGLIAVVLMLAVGYAAINTTLNIVGNIQLKRNSILKVYLKSVNLDGIDLENQISKDRESFTFKQSQLKELGTSTISYEVRNGMEDYDAKVSISCAPEYHNYTSLSYSGEENLIESGASNNGVVSATTTKETKTKLYDIVANQSKGSESSLNYNMTSSATNGRGVYSTNNTDSENEVYFFRGNVSNNNVIFAGYCWQIIRTTETGGIKLLYNGEPTGGHCNPPSGNGIADIKYNEKSDDNAYAGYMYGNPNSSVTETHSNIHDSLLKQEIDKWYEEHILGTIEENLLEDTTWCNDRSISSGTGTGINNTIYGFGGRVNSSSINPTLKCTRDEDKLTVTSGYLKYPIATLTADEIIYAGAGGPFTNDWTTAETKDIFLSPGGTFWTMTPHAYADPAHATYLQGISYFGNGDLSTVYTNIAVRTMGVRPALSLKTGVEIISGDGTNESPYIVAANEDSTNSEETEYICKLNITLAEQEDRLIGMEYCFGTECFNIVDYDGENFKLLSKYNLYVGKNTIDTHENYGHQDPSCVGDVEKDENIRVGTIAFGATNDYSTSNAKKYVDDYVEWLNSTYDLEATGRLITNDELLELGCQLGVSQGCGSAYNKNYEWVTRTTFFTATPQEGTEKIYLVGGDGFFGASDPTNSAGRGVRPLIIVSKDKLSDIKISINKIPISWLDDGIFTDNYKKAYEKLKDLSTEEKIGQLLVMTYSPDINIDYNAIRDYKVGGVLFYENAFEGKSIEEVQNMIKDLQSKADIPLMTAVDEEGGRVCRISTNTSLVSEEMQKYPELFFTNSYGKNAWKLASTLYTESGNNFDLIKKEERVRNSLLKKLGLNMNFAPVADIASPPAYISDRSFGNNADLASQYVTAVVKAGKDSGVSHSLKHFPGYGNNSDTHTSSSVDETSLTDLNNIHLKPFKAGISAGAETVMVSHNIISAVDKTSPASLSAPVHSLLFDELKFTGLAITDDLAMEAVGNNYSQQYLKAFKAGNHILLVAGDFKNAYNELASALENGEFTSEELDKRVFKVLAWKYHTGLFTD